LEQGVVGIIPKIETFGREPPKIIRYRDKNPYEILNFTNKF